MRPYLFVAVVVASLMVGGCATMQSKAIGLYGGVVMGPVGLEILNNEKVDLPDKTFFFAVLVPHAGLATGLFLVNPIIGGAYLAGCAIYGMGATNP